MPLVNPLERMQYILAVVVVVVVTAMTTVGTYVMNAFCSYLLQMVPPVPLSPSFFPPHTACQAALTMNQSLRGFFDGRWGEEVTWLHSFHSLSACPYVLSIIH